MTEAEGNPTLHARRGSWRLASGVLHENEIVFVEERDSVR